MCAEIETTKFPKGKAMSYSMGVFTNSFIYMAYNILVFYYYEVELGLATALVGLSFVIFAVWNMVNDPLVGFFTDKPMKWSKKYGLRAPWILFGGAVQIIAFFFLFYIPFDISDVKSNPWPLFWYMVAMTCIWDTFFSIYQTNMVGGFANIFRTPENRRKGSLILLLIGMFGNTFAQGILIPMVIIYGDPSSYIRAAALACIVLTVSLVAFIPGIHESEEIKERYLRIHKMMEQQKMPYFKLLKIAFKNKPFLVYVTMFTLWITGTFMWQFSQLYIIKEVLNLEITVMAPAMLLFMAFFIPFLFIFTYIAKKTEHIYVSIMAILIVAVDLVLVMFITNTLGFYIVNILFGIGSAAWGGILFSITSDVMDSVCIDAEQHVESTMIGIRTFFLRIAYLAGGGIIAIVHIMTGYIPGATSQSPSAQLGLRLHAGLIPAIMLFVAAILVIKFYDLKGDKKRECLELLRAKGL